MLREKCIEKHKYVRLCFGRRNQEGRCFEENYPNNPSKTGRRKRKFNNIKKMVNSTIYSLILLLCFTLTPYTLIFLIFFLTLHS